MNLDQIISLFSAKGCNRLYVKRLAANDNSKNQVYFGLGFGAINIFPFTDLQAATSGSHNNPIFKARLRFFWLDREGGQHLAPGAQLILYPQYPEVRFSGFLKGCRMAPSALMRDRSAGDGRLLFLGVKADSAEVFGWVVANSDLVVAEYQSRSITTRIGVFDELALATGSIITNTRGLLLSTLSQINAKGWIDAKRLLPNLSVAACASPNCGGYTLEAELGIVPNGRSEPDYLGWEVKQYGVNSFNRIDSGVITLMTPEPNAGDYRELGVNEFIKKYGYADKLGRPNRMNFGGIHKFNTACNATGLTLRLDGYDESNRMLTRSDGYVSLVNSQGEEAAKWSFTSLMEHWNRKHAQAVYVPSLKDGASYRYQYGNKVKLGNGTDFLKLLEAFAVSDVYYDPGIKLELINGVEKTKRRSQFRIKVNRLSSLYQSFEEVELG